MSFLNVPLYSGQVFFVTWMFMHQFHPYAVGRPLERFSLECRKLIAFALVLRSLRLVIG